MKINPYTDTVRVPAVDQTSAQRPAQEVQQASPVRQLRADSIEISDAGRRMNAEQRDALDPERIAELREKVLTGAYNTLDVVDQVARRILTRGDI